VLTSIFCGAERSHIFGAPPFEKIGVNQLARGRTDDCRQFAIASDSYQFRSIADKVIE
jgi:hypothetical protein